MNVNRFIVQKVGEIFKFLKDNKIQIINGKKKAKISEQHVNIIIR